MTSIYHTIVIGSGIAGLNFALNAANYGKVLVITKKRTVESSTNRAQGGIAAVLDQTDNVKQHVADTLEAGAHHNVKRAVEFMVKNGPEAIMRLVEMGVPFATDEEGHILLTREGGHGKRRIAFVGDYTGQEIERALVHNVTAHPNITVWEYTFAADLLVKNKRCYGVTAIKENRAINILAPNIVIATGGIGQLYKYTTNPIISTSDGLAMGLRAGLMAKDTEFIQFHPTAFKRGGRTKFLLSEALRGEGAHLLNKAGERFMLGIHPRAELAPRDIVARHVYREDLAGGAFLDIRHENARTLKLRFPQIYQKLKKHGLDLTKDLIPIAPAAHYSCGGLQTNLSGETAIKGLYAFGEVSWTGVHGANRLASNSLLEALVFSSQIVDQVARSKPFSKIPDFSTPTYQKASDTKWQHLKKIRRDLQNLMWENVGIERTTDKLKQALRDLEKLEKKLPHSATLNVPERETENMLLSAKTIAQAALKRRKSLGSHHIT